MKWSQEEILRGDPWIMWINQHEAQIQERPEILQDLMRALLKEGREIFYFSLPEQGLPAQEGFNRVVERLRQVEKKYGLGRQIGSLEFWLSRLTNTTDAAELLENSRRLRLLPDPLEVLRDDVIALAVHLRRFGHYSEKVGDKMMFVDNEILAEHLPVLISEFIGADEKGKVSGLMEQAAFKDLEFADQKILYVVDRIMFQRLPERILYLWAIGAGLDPSIDPEEMAENDWPRFYPLFRRHREKIVKSEPASRLSRRAEMLDQLARLRRPRSGELIPVESVIEVLREIRRTDWRRFGLLPPWVQRATGYSVRRYTRLNQRHWWQDSRYLDPVFRFYPIETGYPWDSWRDILGPGMDETRDTRALRYHAALARDIRFLTAAARSPRASAFEARSEMRRASRMPAVRSRSEPARSEMRADSNGPDRKIAGAREWLSDSFAPLKEALGAEAQWLFSPQDLKNHELVREYREAVKRSILPESEKADRMRALNDLVRFVLRDRQEIWNHQNREAHWRYQNDPDLEWIKKEVQTAEKIMRAQDFERALKMYDSLQTKLRENNEEVEEFVWSLTALRKARALSRIDRYGEALEAARAGLEADPWNKFLGTEVVWIRYFWGLHDKKSGKTKQARDHFERAIGLADEMLEREESWAVLNPKIAAMLESREDQAAIERMLQFAEARVLPEVRAKDAANMRKQIRDYRKRVRGMMFRPRRSEVRRDPGRAVTDKMRERINRGRGNDGNEMGRVPKNAEEFAGKYAVEIDLEDFAAMTEDQRGEFYKLIREFAPKAGERDRNAKGEHKVEFIFEGAARQAPESMMEELRRFKKQFSNLKIIPVSGPHLGPLPRGEYPFSPPLSFPQSSAKQPPFGVGGNLENGFPTKAFGNDRLNGYRGEGKNQKNFLNSLSPWERGRVREDRKVIRVFNEGSRTEAALLRDPSGRPAGHYFVRYRSANQSAGLLTAALQLLESGREDLVEREKYFSEIPAGYVWDARNFLAADVYVRGSA